MLAIGLGVSSDVPQRPSSGPPAGINLPASPPVVQTPIDSAGVFVPAEKGPRIHPPLKQTKAPKGGSAAPGPGPGPGDEPGGGTSIRRPA